MNITVDLYRQSVEFSMLFPRPVWSNENVDHQGLVGTAPCGHQSAAQGASVFFLVDVDHWKRAPVRLG